MLPDEYLTKAGLTKETIEKIAKQNGQVLPPLLEHFLIMGRWQEEFSKEERKDYGIPDTLTWEDYYYLARLIRDLAVEVIKLKEAQK